MDEQFLLQRIYRRYESKDLDYKSPVYWDEKDKSLCCGLVKDILAMANSGGGDIVIGVEEPQSNAFVPVGLSDTQAKSFDTHRLNRFVNKYAEPPINSQVMRLENGGQTFVVIRVPRFPWMPHICTRA